MKFSIITGGSSGLGLELAKKLVELKRNIIIIGRNKEKLENSVKILKNINSTSEIKYFQLDISNLEEVDNFFNDLSTRKIEINYLYNNAGKGFFGNVENLGREDINSVLGSNLIGLINMTSRVILHMKNLNYKCRIVNILSTAALKGKKFESIYNASKWGAKGFLESVRDETSNSNIEIIIYYPGGMKTEFWNNIDSGYNFNNFMNAENVAEEIIKTSLNENMLISDIVINRRK